MLRSVNTRILLIEIYILCQTKFIGFATSKNDFHCQGGNVCIVAHFLEFSFCCHGAVTSPRQSVPGDQRHPLRQAQEPQSSWQTAAHAEGRPEPVPCQFPSLGQFLLVLAVIETSISGDFSLLSLLLCMVLRKEWGDFSVGSNL